MYKHDKLIRLRRIGHKHYPIFEIVVTRSKKRNSSFFEQIGFFNPNRTERILMIDLYKLGCWLNRGFRLKISVKRLLLHYGSKNIV